MRQHYLHEPFAPEGIAVFGANWDKISVGGRVLRNLREAGYPDGLYPVNRHHETVQGFICHARIRDAGVPVDLAIIATPAAAVPGVLRDCGEHGVAVAVVMSPGLGEGGEPGVAASSGSSRSRRRTGCGCRARTASARTASA